MAIASPPKIIMYKIRIIVKIMPVIPMVNPKRKIKPSLLIMPREIIKMETPGNKLVKGNGSKTEEEKIKDNMPIILSLIISKIKCHLD